MRFLTRSSSASVIPRRNAVRAPKRDATSVALRIVAVKSAIVALSHAPLMPFLAMQTAFA